MSPHKKLSLLPFKQVPTARGFTLIELLMVIAIIGVLAGITFGISNGVSNAQARAKVKVELASIAQALEQYKLTHGEYPLETDDDDGQGLFNALLGWKAFSGGAYDDLDAGDVPVTGPKSFIDPTKLDFYGDLPTVANVVPVECYFVDPWGNPYVYVYGKVIDPKQNKWELFGYHLYSLGEDGEDGSGLDVDTGLETSAYREDNKSIDNIYFGE